MPNLAVMKLGPMDENCMKERLAVSFSYDFQSGTDGKYTFNPGNLGLQKLDAMRGLYLYADFEQNGYTNQGSAGLDILVPSTGQRIAINPTAGGQENNLIWQGAIPLISNPGDSLLFTKHSNFGWNPAGGEEVIIQQGPAGSTDIFSGPGGTLPEFSGVIWGIVTNWTLEPWYEYTVPQPQALG